MSEDDELPIRMRGRGELRRLAQATAFIARRVRATGARAVAGERGRDVRVQPAKGANRESVPEHVLDGAVAAILARAQTVAVLEARSPASQFALPWPEPVVDARVALEHVAAPAVVVAGDHQDRDAIVREIRERPEHAKAAARYDGLPLEPELEQVAVDHDGARAPAQRLQKSAQRALDLGRCIAEMRVGDDVARRGKHAHSLSRACLLYKLKPIRDLRAVTGSTESDAGARSKEQEIEFRVRYAETDQMGVVYHANYLVWCEMGRTDLIRQRGISYA